MATQNSTASLPCAEHSRHSSPDAAAFMKSLTALNELSAGHMRMNELTLERCRVAAEWRQAVEEQGAVLLRTIRFRMAEVLSQTWKAVGEKGITDRNDLTPEQTKTLDLFGKHSEPLSEQIADLVLAHQGLQSCIGQLAHLMVEIESRSEAVMDCSEKIRANELVRCVMDQPHQ